MPESTESPTASLRLSSLRAGTVVKIQTRVSVYWISITMQCRTSRQGDRTTGVAVSSNKEGYVAPRVAPTDLAVDSKIVIGKPFTIDGKPTSRVTSFETL